MGKVAIWLGAIFTPIGLIFLAVGGWFYLADRDLASSGVRTPGTVIEMAGGRDSDGDYSYRPVVQFFDANGTRHVFASSVSSSPPSYSTGERVTVIYRPGAPDDAIIDSFVDRFLLPLIFGGLGAIFAAVGLGMLAAWFRRRRLVARLRTSGLPIQAKFVECYRDTRIAVNGRSPFRVVCQATHPATGQLQSFESDPIWIDLTERLAGRDLRVFVDPARPKHHAVDLSAFVPESEMG